MQKYTSRYQSKPAYTPRSIRKIEDRTKRNLVITILIAIALLFFLVTWGIPSLIGSLGFLNKFKQTDTPVDITNEAIAPPNLYIPFEATNSAKIKVVGNSTPNAKVEIYIDDSLKSTLTTNYDGSFQTEEIDLTIGQNGIYGKTVDDKGNKSLPSKTIRVTYDNSVPKLEISEPDDNKVIQGGDKKVRVSGKVDGANSVTINNQSIILSNDGSFSREISLNDGQNTITIIAASEVGSTTKIDKLVTYNP